jgi:3-methyladenine DNA glycosylase AlkD
MPSVKKPASVPARKPASAGKSKPKPKPAAKVVTKPVTPPTPKKVAAPEKPAPAKAPAKAKPKTFSTGTLTIDDVLSKLRKLGSPAIAEVYRKHGAKGELFGVKLADLTKLAKEIGSDHMLADGLWHTRNFDAQNLACMIADPKALTLGECATWLKFADSAVTAEAFAGVVGRSAHVRECFDEWSKSSDQYIRRSAYAALNVGLNAGVKFPVEALRNVLADIERQIHKAPNRAKEGMNFTVIAIGTCCDELADEALATAQRIGKVTIDHADGAGRDFDAVEEITRARASKGKKK